MLSTHKFVALVLIGSGIAVAAACSLITDVDRSKIEGTGGAPSTDDGGTSTGGSSTGGSTSTEDAGGGADAG